MHDVCREIQRDEDHAHCVSYGPIERVEQSRVSELGMRFVRGAINRFMCDVLEAVRKVTYR